MNFFIKRFIYKFDENQLKQLHVRNDIKQQFTLTKNHGSVYTLGQKLYSVTKFSSTKLKEIKFRS